jgi:DNA-binding LytR/AlgR family response regulator
MITCYIVDDEAHAIQVLERYIRQTPGLQLLGSEENPLEALNAISQGLVRPEVVFADIDMPQLSGVKFAELIAPYTRVVFTTAYPDFALDAFDRNAVDYLLKPILYERFLRAVGRIRERRKELLEGTKAGGAHYFFIKGEVKGKMVRINLKQLLYVEALQNYVRLHLEKEKLVTYLTMKEIEEYLLSAGFYRVHKSYIVHLDKVIAVEGNQVILENKAAIPLGASYREGFLECVNTRLLKSRRLP